MTKFSTDIGALILFALVIVTMTGFKPALAEETTQEPEASVSRCYKCEGDCNGGVGKVESCHPDSGDNIKFACYKLVVDGKAFQRGCTRDFSEGEECVDQNGRMYCFCRKDACNKSSSLMQNISKLFILCVTIEIMMISFQRFL